MPRLLRTAGLTDVRAEGHVAIGSASSPVADLYRANIEQTRDELIDAGLLTGRQTQWPFLNRPRNSCYELRCEGRWHDGVTGGGQ